MKIFFKRAVSLISYMISTIYVLLFKVTGDYKSCSIKVSKYTGYLGFEIRRNFYERTLKKVGHSLRVHYGAYIVYPNVTIGDRCSIEEFSVISLCDIGDDVIFAANVSLMSGGNQHEIDDLDCKFHDSNLPPKKIKIGSNVWIGTHSVIMNNVANGTVVAAGAVVNKSFKENAVIGGVPAKLIRMRGQ